MLGGNGHAGKGVLDSINRMNGSSESKPLSDQDVGGIVRLLADVCAQQSDLESSRRFLINGLCKLVGADCWVWGLFPKTEPGERVVTAGFMHGGLSGERLAPYMEAVEHPDMAKLNAPFIGLLDGANRQVTRLRQQLDPKDDFKKLPVYEYWKRADIGPLVLSARRLDDECLSLIALYRRNAADLFDERESRIAHILLSEVNWLHSVGWETSKDMGHRELPPRQRTTLNLLLHGMSRKQIAGNLGISENTVSGYVKSVYRSYGVRSQAELMHHFRYGDGGDA